MMSSMTCCTPYLIILPRCTRSAAWRRAVRLPDIVAVPSKWSTGLALHCGCIVAASPHIMQALSAHPAYTSCRPMMALTPDALETCARVLETCELCCIGKPARLSFMLEACSTQRTVGHAVAAPETSR
jgi:hypothetical protein